MGADACDAVGRAQDRACRTAPVLRGQTPAPGTAGQAGGSSAPAGAGGEGCGQLDRRRGAVSEDGSEVARRSAAGRGRSADESSARPLDRPAPAPCGAPGSTEPLTAGDRRPRPRGPITGTLAAPPAGVGPRNQRRGRCAHRPCCCSHETKQPLESVAQSLGRPACDVRRLPQPQGEGSSQSLARTRWRRPSTTGAAVSLPAEQLSGDDPGRAGHRQPRRGTRGTPTRASGPGPMKRPGPSSFERLAELSCRAAIHCARRRSDERSGCRAAVRWS